uniref:Uncharacterized protein n=1 Tax=Acrobeloides nanus TaxID=290746 RepID=A0A914EAL6_9BILA
MQYLITLLLLLTGLVFTMAQPRPNFGNQRPKEFPLKLEGGGNSKGFGGKLTGDFPVGDRGVKVQPWVDGYAAKGGSRLTGGGVGVQIPF